jgi:hypothetical protein
MSDGCSQRLLNGRAQGRRDGLSHGPGAVSDVRHRRDPALCPSLVALAQLSQLHWSHCRSRTVTATGKITYCGTGCTTLTARVQRLWAAPPHNPQICALGTSAYSRPRVMLPNGSSIYNVGREDAGC